MEKAANRLAWGLGLVALGFYAALPMGRLFSDGQFLIDLVEASPAPYYNVAFVPLGHGLHAALEPLLGGSVERALTIFSALLMAAGVTGTLRLGARLGLGAGVLFVAGLLLIFSPGALFFAGVVEVHPMQFAGAVWALGLAWSAGERSGAAAWRGLGVACLVAFLAHLSHALFLPGLWLVARRSPGPDGALRGCRIGRRGWPWIVAALALFVGTLVYLSGRDFASLSRRSDTVWVSALWVFAKNFVDASLERGFYSLREMGEYLTDELVLQAGLLIVGLAAGGFAWVRHFVKRASGSLAGEFAARSSPMILPAVLVFAQGGILEHGAYFLSYFPAMGLSIAWLLQHSWGERLQLRGWLLVGLVLAAPQLGLALRERSLYRDSRLDARAWLAAIDAELGPGDSIITSTLAREYALEVARPDLAIVDLKRRMDSMPARGRSALLQKELGIAMARLAGAEGAGRSMWIDMDLFTRRWPGPSEAWRDELAVLLDFPGVHVEEASIPHAALLRVTLAK